MHLTSASRPWMFVRHPRRRAVLASTLPMLAFAVLGYLMYSAGAAPADPKDLYQAWFVGAGVIGTSLLIVAFGKRVPALRS